MRTVIAAVFALVLLSSTANATDWCNGNGGSLDVGGGAYVTFDCGMFTPECSPLNQGAIYAETNAARGLQRGGNDLVFASPDWCQDSPDPDLFVAWW